jgi:hypothetical protein
MLGAAVLACELVGLPWSAIHLSKLKIQEQTSGDHRVLLDEMEGIKDRLSKMEKGPSRIVISDGQPHIQMEYSNEPRPPRQSISERTRSRGYSAHHIRIRLTR